jgi:predicted transposase YbfD/YdcC
MTLPLAAVFADLPDPRRETANKRHALTDILVIATCAVISDCDTWDDIAEYGQSKEDFFRRFLPLTNGVPSADTFSRVFAKLNPARFAEAFGRWVAAACERSGLVPVAIDGKAVRSAPATTAAGCLTVVSAWATEQRLALGQVVVPDGSNEIGVIPELLRALDLTKALVTLDAAGCQVANAAIIREQKGHYLLAVKGNQPTLHAAVEGAFERACDAEFVGVRHDTHAEIEDGHGRHEERSVTVLYQPDGLPDEWVGAKAVVQVCRERVVDGVRTSTTHYYLSSHTGTAEQMARFIRGHWGIENGLHWVLDVVFGEDDSRVRERHAGANLAMIRRVAVSLLRRTPGRKKRATTPTKRKRAGWDDEFLLQVLQGITG